MLKRNFGKIAKNDFFIFSRRELLKQLLKKMIKQRNESIEIYKKSNRNDLLDIEKKEVQKENHYGVFGRILHFIISETIKHKLFHSWDIVDTMYTQAYHNDMLTNSKLEPPKHQGFYWQGKSILKKWKKDFLDRGWDNSETLMLETYFRIPLKENLQFSDYIDFIMKFENELYLIDWKSNKEVIPEEELEILKKK